ncbi:MAG: hypothetical protein QS748_11560 [Candidatus Endonucleobacter bathymodioli]|uniref:Uncharacterized protein n=1 Tax=Candidatus Endonucleibacter bathymodioli TaxID=539814 RepID=A0AA90P2B3_9GAMM|nr:hypothetical protein [Candidatus Endonucleobacter bathymodioli]
MQRYRAKVSLYLLRKNISHNNGAVFKYFPNEIHLSLEKEQQLEFTAPLSKALKILGNRISQLMMQSQRSKRCLC